MNLYKTKHFYKNKYVLSKIFPNEYFLCYNYKYKVLWFRVAKVGSRTIDSYFRKNTPPNQYIYSSPTAYNPDDFTDFFKFAFVRDPLQRFLSAWRNKVLESNYFAFSDLDHEAVKELPNFIEWVSKQDLRSCDEHLRLQSSLIDVNNIDYIGRMRSFDRDFKEICDLIGMPVGHVVKKNQTKKVATEIPEKETNKIKKLYQIDYQVFFP